MRIDGAMVVLPTPSDVAHDLITYQQEVFFAAPLRFAHFPICAPPPSFFLLARNGVYVSHFDFIPSIFSSSCFSGHICFLLARFSMWGCIRISNGRTTICTSSRPTNLRTCCFAGILSAFLIVIFGAFDDG